MQIPSLGTILSGLAILIALVIAWFQRRPKRLTIETPETQSMLSSGQYGEAGDLQVAYKGSVVTAPQLVRVRVVNSGKQSIRSADWEVGCRIEVTGTGKIVDASLGPCSKGVDPAFKRVDSASLEVGGVLLNSGDFFEIQMLVDGTDFKLTPSARVAGAEVQLGKRDPPANLSIRFALAAVAVMATIAAAGVFLTDTSVRSSNGQMQEAPLAPNLIGMQVGDATLLLRTRNLPLRDESYIQNSKALGKVVKQYPAPGEPVSSSGVRLVVSQGVGSAPSKGS